MSMRRPRALSLVEALLAMVVASVLVVVLMRYFLGTQRRAVVSEARLHAAVLAQMVVERIRSHVTVNPAYLKWLGVTSGARKTFSGAVVDPASAVGGGGGGAAGLSPFFEHLFAKGDEDLYADANRVSIAPVPAGGGPRERTMGSLLDAFRDYRVGVTLEDDTDLEGPVGGPTPRSWEDVKRLTVTVTRASASTRGPDPQAFTLVTRIVTPTESLSDASLEGLLANFDSPAALQAAWEEFFLTVGDNPYFKDEVLGPDSKRLLADCYIVLGAINTEAYLVTGETVVGSIVLTEARPTRAIDAWIDLLTEPAYYNRHSVFKKAAARVRTTKLRTIFDTFKKVIPVLQHMYTEHGRMLPRLDKIIEALQEARQRLVRLDQESWDAMKAYREGRKLVAEGNARQAEGAKLIAEGNAKLAEAARLDLQAAGPEARAKALLDEAKELEARAKASPSEDDAKALREEAKKKREEAKKLLEEAKKLREEASKRRSEGQSKISEGNSRTADGARLVAEGTAKMNSSIQTLQAGMENFVTILQAKGEDLVAVIELVAVCKFLRDFFSETTYRRIVDRLRDYYRRFETTLVALESDLRQHLATQDGPTPHEQVMTAHALVEATKVHALATDSAPADLVSTIKALSGHHASRMRELSRYLGEGEVHDWGALARRNARFAAKMRVMKDISDPTNPANLYERVVELYSADGKITRFIEVYTQISQEIRLSSSSVLAELQRQVQSLRQELGYVSDATAREIIQAMQSGQFMPPSP